MKVLLEGHSLLPPRTGVGYTTMQILLGLAENPSIEEIHLLLSMIPTNPKLKSFRQEVNDMDLANKLILHHWPIPYEWLLRSWYHLNWPRMESFISGLDIVHGPAHVLPCASRPMKLLTVHDLTLIEHPEWFPKSAHHLRKALIHGIHHADHIMVNSHDVSDKLKRVFSIQPEKITAHHLPIDPDYHIYDQAMKQNIREQILGSSDPYMVWIGEINPRKNLALLIPVLQWLKEHGDQNMKLVLIGKMGYQSESLLHDITDHGLTYAMIQNQKANHRNSDVLFMGYIDENQKKQLLSAAEIMIYPSLEEGFGIPVLESFASGIPVICSNGGALPEIAGEAGWIINLEDGWEPFAKAALQLLSSKSLYQEYHEKGLARIKQFDRNHYLSNLFQTYGILD